MAGAGLRVPTRIYRIIHADNLPSILGAGGIHAPNSTPPSTAPYMAIHHLSVQAQRAETRVPTGAQGVVHDYVPFYFNPRSPMLYAIHMGNVPGYSEGQRPIMVLVSSAQAIEAAPLDFVFTDGHSIMVLSRFYDDLGDLQQIRWNVIWAQYWTRFEDGSRLRQAEFMVHNFFPWNLVERIGVYDAGIKAQVEAHLSKFPLLHQPPVEARRDFFF